MTTYFVVVPVIWVCSFETAVPLKAEKMAEFSEVSCGELDGKLPVPPIIDVSEITSTLEEYPVSWDALKVKWKINHCDEWQTYKN